MNLKIFQKVKNIKNSSKKFLSAFKRNLILKFSYIKFKQLNYYHELFFKITFY